MVKISEGTEDERLDRLMRRVSARHGLKLLVQGWARKTYDVFKNQDQEGKLQPYAQVESFVTRSGEITIFTDQALPFAQDLGQELEAAFDISEAVILRRKPG